MPRHGGSAAPTWRHSGGSGEAKRGRPWGAHRPRPYMLSGSRVRSSPAARKRFPRESAAAAAVAPKPLSPIVKMAAAACLLALLLALSLTPGLLQGDTTPAGVAIGTQQLLNAAGQPLLTPTKLRIDGHDVYVESPVPTPRGLLLILHKCGRSGSDFWPRSVACKECMGLPEGLAKTKQALRRRYAVAAMSSRDRRAASGGRCFAWGEDADAAAKVLQTLPKQLGLPEGAPIYVDGASSGGSLGLRLPRIARFDGVVGEVIGPPDFDGVLDEMERDSMPMPPALYIHMPTDEGMAPKVADNIAALKRRGKTVGEIRVLPRPVHPKFFSNCSPLISPPLSARLHARLRAGRFVDREDNLIQDLKNSEWNDWREYLESQFPQDVARLKASQREQDTELLAAHMWECLGVAWGRHETIADYMTAALKWLEGGGREDAAELAERYGVHVLSEIPYDPLPMGGDDDR